MKLMYRCFTITWECANSYTPFSHEVQGPPIPPAQNASMIYINDFSKEEIKQKQMKTGELSPQEGRKSTEGNPFSQWHACKSESLEQSIGE